LFHLLVAILLVSSYGCATRAPVNGGHESLGAVLWTQTSAEYAATTLQAYRLAAENLDRALEDPQWTAALEQGNGYSRLPPAVILDLDQTVLDTSPYNARIVLDYGSHSQQRFAEWCRESTAPAIPGVKDFLDRVVERGVTVIYISARAEALRECTTKNLESLGLPLAGQQHLLLRDGTPKTRKTVQRTWAAAQHRILLLIGDDLGDFVEGARSDRETRRVLVDEHAGRWGRQWIILANPMYGSWSASLYGFDHSMPREKRLDRMAPQLRP
jgi:acid phosphatase